MPISDLGQQLDRIAAARGWNAARLAKQLGLSPSTLSRLRNGLRPPAADEIDGWARRLGLAGDERSAFIDAGLIDAAPAAVRDRLRAAPAPVQPEPRAPDWHDGRWLTYSRSFSDDGLIQRSLITIDGGRARLEVREAGRLRFSYHGTCEVLGDKVFIRVAEDRGGAEYVQITCDSFFDYQSPTFLSGIVCGISGRDPRHPVSRPAAARILLLHVDDGADDTRIATLLTTGPDQAMTPFWPAACGDGGLLRAALRLDLRETLDEAVVRLIDNRITHPGGVLRTILS
jgi:transcriptional regulator with XRE-family HTH domain